MTKSFEAGIKAAQRGISIDNSYPNNHEEFVQGYRSIKPNAREDLDLKVIAMNMSPEEYPYEEVDGPITNKDVYLFKKNNTVCSGNVSPENIEILNVLRERGHVVKVQLKALNH